MAIETNGIRIQFLKLTFPDRLYRIAFFLGMEFPFITARTGLMTPTTQAIAVVESM